ncbi:MAG: HPr family phosphocarrier protein [Thermoguttaceae bacterium]
MSENSAVRTVVVSHPNGLCMRGASSICRLAGRFRSKIELVKERQRVSTADPLEIVLLAAEQGSELVVEATGPDAEEALDAMARLFADRFGVMV